MNLTQAMLNLQSALAAVPCVNNGSVSYLNSLEVAITDALVVAQTTTTGADAALALAAPASNFASGVPLSQLLENVNSLVALTNAVPYLVDVENQLGVMLKLTESVET